MSGYRGKREGASGMNTKTTEGATTSVRQETTPQTNS